MEDFSKLSLVYTAAPHVTQRPSVTGGSLLTYLYNKLAETNSGIAELDQLIALCNSLLNDE